jgi:adenylate cyclase
MRFAGIVCDTGMTQHAAVPQEIERKFLVANDGWRRGADTGSGLRQAYLAETDRAVVRVRIENGARGVLTIKSAGSGMSRQEFEIPLKLDDAEALMALRQGSELRKTRYRAPYAGLIWEVDVYEGDNAGLVIAEVELESERQDVALPDWVGREVTGAGEYYAVRLAQRPYASWPEAERARGG